MKYKTTQMAAAVAQIETGDAKEIQIDGSSSKYYRNRWWKGVKVNNKSYLYSYLYSSSSSTTLVTVTRGVVYKNNTNNDSSGMDIDWQRRGSIWCISGRHSYNSMKYQIDNKFCSSQK